MELNLKKQKNNLFDISIERIMNNRVRFNLNILILFTHRLAYQHSTNLIIIKIKMLSIQKIKINLKLTK